MTPVKPIISRGWLAVVLVVAILLTDQAIKIWVKTNMSLYEAIHITDWFYIRFIENNGMAYGLELGSKILLSVFRIAAIALIGRYLYTQVRQKARWGYVVCLSMVVAGATGNIIDSLVYGQIFSASSEFYVSYFVPFGTGYAPVLMGKVVDMFYFPIVDTVYPDWFPLWAGERFVFFSPIFNFADACISVGVVLLLLFYRKEISSISFSLKSKADTGQPENQTQNPNSINDR